MQVKLRLKSIERVKVGSTYYHLCRIVCLRCSPPCVVRWR